MEMPMEELHKFVGSLQLENLALQYQNEQLKQTIAALSAENQPEPSE